MAGLDDVDSKLQTGYYKNEYDFHYDIWSIVTSANDFHYVYNLDILNVFSWQREHQLVSLSTDGIELPSVFVYDDIASANRSGTAPSPVVKINDIDVETWLNDQAGMNPWDHDPDANYNSFLWSAVKVNQGDASANGTYASLTRPQSSLTKLTFADGREVNDSTFASSIKDFTGVTDGKTFFAKFCSSEAALSASASNDSNPDTISSSGAATATTFASFTAVSTQTTATPSSTFFPTPLVLTSDLSLAGYLPDELPDTAVLQVPSFEPVDDLDFQNSVRALLATAQSQGRSKLIIDLRGNGGGEILLGYDLFSQIFPHIKPYGGSNIRSIPVYRNIIQALWDSSTNAQSTDVNSQLQDSNGSRYSDFEAGQYFNGNETPFSTAQESYGPYHRYDDDFTAIQRVNLNSSGYIGGQSYGSGQNTLPLPQVFQPENIVLLQDGLCGSTCAIFSEFMKSQAQVKTIAVGGRKQNGPMQGVGGSKGAEVIDFSTFWAAARAASLVTNSSVHSALQDAVANMHPGAQALKKRTHGGEDVSINYRNNIRQGDESYTPLQYVYEAADCRIFYTAPMLSNQMVLYKMTHDIHWGNASCVPGSAGHPSSLSGSLLSYIDAYPPTGANYTFNAPHKAWPSNVVNAASSSNSTITPSVAPTNGPNRFASSTTYLGVSTSTPISASTTTSSGTATISAVPSQTPSSMASLQRRGCGIGAFVAVGLALHQLVG